VIAGGYSARAVLALFFLLACQNQHPIMHTLFLTPHAACRVVGDETVVPRIMKPSAEDGWTVVVAISRNGTDPTQHASDIDVNVYDRSGVALAAVEKPQGALVEMGGSLGTTGNARYRLDATDTLPAVHVVTYRGEALRFDLHESKSSEPQDRHAP